MAATVSDIAARLKVSRSTVSRVLNNRCQNFISQATRERVQKAAEELGYAANPFAQALATGRTNLIGYWSPDVYERFFVMAALHMHRALREDGYDMISRDAKLQTDAKVRADWPVDGTIAVCTSSDWLQSGLTSRRLPAVPTVHVSIIRASRDPQENLDVVDVDLLTGAKEAVTHLVGLGCKRIAYLLYADMNAPEEDRHKAYATVMRKSGMKPEYIVISDRARRVVRQEIQEYVRAHGCPDGIFCCNDDEAIGAYRGLRDMGVRIPEDVALVGCDGIEDTECLDVPISTIVMPVEEMCRTAWQFLKRRIQNPGIPQQQTVLRTHLAVRESSQR